MADEPAPEPIIIEGDIDEVLAQLEELGFWGDDKT